MIDKEFFDWHALTLKRQIEFAELRQKVIADIDYIKKAVQEYIEKENLEQDGITFESLFSEVRSNFRFKINRGESFINIDQANHKEWYDEKRKSNRPFWDRYKIYLSESSMPRASREALDVHTDGILSRCEDPNDTNRVWNTKALVLGSVQQGKTSNYIGLTCKAADAGYKLFIVLTGMHDDLRTQTQIRFDEGFTGYESGPLTEYIESSRSSSFIGVGKINPNVFAHTITHRRLRGDVKKSSLFSYNGISFADKTEKPYILVCKKNQGVLNSIIQWLDQKFGIEEGGKITPDIPLFLIDDEADQASVDTSTTNSPKKINAQIRRILNTFTNSCYIAYTATAYANLLIDHSAERVEQTYMETRLKKVEGQRKYEKTTIAKNVGEDLFPKHFMSLLPQPDNYVGFEDLFPNENTENFDEKIIECEKYIRIIDDHTDQNGNDGWMPINAHSRANQNHIPKYENKEEIPPSLKKAIYTFILASAVKNLRNLPQKHSSMMVHVTYKNSIQGEVRQQIDNFVKELKDNLHKYNPNNEYWKQLKLLWDNDINHKKHIVQSENPKGAPIDWQNIVDIIIYPDKDSIIDRLETIQLSGTSSEILDYNEFEKKGSVLIVVGGAKLSRGLTLSGLCVSYYARYAATKLADTVTQMARWFGYRDGYKDVCRIYLTEIAREAFEEFSSLDEETRTKAEALDKRSDLNLEEVLISMRSTPGYLATAKLKMQSTLTYKLDLAGTYSTPRILTAEDNKQNHKSIKKFLDKVALNKPTYLGNMATLYEEKNLMKNEKADLIWKVNYKEVLDFLNSYSFAPVNIKLEKGTWEKYIKEKQQKTGELTNWNIILKRGGLQKADSLKFGNYEVNYLSERKNDKSSSEIFDIGTMYTSSDSHTILNQVEEEEARALIKADDKIKTLSMRKSLEIYSKNKKNNEIEGFLFIGPTKIKNAKYKEILYPIAIAFPNSNDDSKVSVTVNKATVEKIEKYYGKDQINEVTDSDDEE